MKVPYNGVEGDETREQLVLKMLAKTWHHHAASAKCLTQRSLVWPATPPAVLLSRKSGVDRADAAAGKELIKELTGDGGTEHKTLNMDPRKVKGHVTNDVWVMGGWRAVIPVPDDRHSSAKTVANSGLKRCRNQSETSGVTEIELDNCIT